MRQDRRIGGCTAEANSPSASDQHDPSPGCGGRIRNPSGLFPRAQLPHKLHRCRACGGVLGCLGLFGCVYSDLRAAGSKQKSISSAYSHAPSTQVSSTLH